MISSKLSTVRFVDAPACFIATIAAASEMMVDNKAGSISSASERISSFTTSNTILDVFVISMAARTSRSSASI